MRKLLEGWLVCFWILLVTAVAVYGSAQTPSAALGFDAVVVKPNQSGINSTRISTGDAKFDCVNASVKNLLANAYGIREGLISGLPHWAESARFDVTAKVVDPDLKIYDNLPREQQRAMLAHVLEERFHLKVHIEVKTLPVYNMVVAKDGPKIQESAMPKVDPDAPKSAFGPGSVNTTRTEFNGNSISLSSLTMQLSYVLGRPVIDKTGLTGKYTFDLKYSPDDGQAAADDAPPNIFTAMQEQLGLKLQAGTGPVDTLVVDRIELPTEN